MEIHAPLLAQRREKREGERPPAAHFSSSSPFPQRRMVLQRMRKCNPMDQKKPPREKRGDNVCQCGSVGDGRRHMEQCAVGTSIYGRKNVRLHFLKDAHVLYKNCFSSIKLFGRLCRFRTESTENWGVVYACKSFTSSGGGPSSSPPNLLSTGRVRLLCVGTYVVHSSSSQFSVSPSEWSNGMEKRTNRRVGSTS